MLVRRTHYERWVQRGHRDSDESDGGRGGRAREDRVKSKKKKRDHVSRRST